MQYKQNFMVQTTEEQYQRNRQHKIDVTMRALEIRRRAEKTDALITVIPMSHAKH